MSISLFSPSWYRVASLKPRLRKHVEIHRHDYQGKIWFILQDHVSGRSHRLSPAAYRLVSLMNGDRDVQKLWDLANEQLSDRAPTQDETIRLLGQLHAADAMIVDATPDSREVFRRHQRFERQKMKQKIWSPLAVRLPIWDPDKFLDLTWPLVRPFFGWTCFILWLILVTVGVVLAVMHFTAITENIFDRALSPSNLFVLWLVYPVVKAVHELGHGYAVKKNSGEVHEIGIMLLVLIPVPYVDASAASGFRNKYDRMLVGGIGIMAELAMASIALIVWLNVETGAVHAIAYNVMLIGGVSTLLFNGNPLLRFDGYYVLADWLEIPNLGTRANKHLSYIITKYAFGSKDAEPVTQAPWERFWFVTYGIAAFVYRMMIMFTIIMYIGGRFFFVGVLLAIWAGVTQIMVPLSKGVKFLFNSHKIKSNRPRAFVVTGGVLTALCLLLFVMPFPHRSIVDGVTWPSDGSQIRAKTDGFVADIPLQSDTMAESGDVVLRSEDQFLAARETLILAQLKALDIEKSALAQQDRVQAQLIAEEIIAARGDLTRVREQLQNLDLRAPRSGRVVLLNEHDLEGRYLRKGTLVGFVVNQGDTQSLRVVVDQDAAGFVRNKLKKVEIIPAGWTVEPISATVLRETPGAAGRLPTPALGTLGGGSIPVDPRDPDGVRTLERVFEFELLLPEGQTENFLGRRATVKLDYGYEPVGFQLYTALRQLFLRLYNV